MTRPASPEPVTAVTDLAGAWLPARLSEVERRLAEIVAEPGEPLAADAGATLAAGGKRMRPLLVLLCAGAGAGREAIRAATAIELVHMATLVHDDVLDRAPLRRGRPTVVATSGRGRALSTGDLLFSRAFAELTEAGSERQVRSLAAASVALARGELAQRQDAFDVSITAERYLDRCRLKTAALFECACVIGRDRPDPERRALQAFGREIGVAFQLLDDVLDIVGPPERTGKARGTDLLDGTVNLPLIRARETAPELGQIDLRSLDPGAAEAVCEKIAETGATEAVRAEARERVRGAKSGLRAAGLGEADGTLFELVADGVVERYS